MPAEVETMFSVREVPWHGLGTVVQEAPDSERALVLAGLDWEVVHRPVYVDGREVPEYKANVRSSDGRVLGIVSSKYTVVQNRQAFEFTDALLGMGVRYETAGSLRGGKVVWLLARLEEYREIQGDRIDPYLLFTNGHDGGHAVRVCVTPVRVVCMNTLNMAVSQASRMWSAFHVGDLEGKLHEARRTLDLTLRYLDGLEVLAGQLLGTDLPQYRWQRMVEELLPMPEDPTPVQRRNVETLREDLLARILAPDLARFRETGWAAVNAVADHVAHVAPLRETKTWRESRFARIAFGHPMLDRAVEMLVSRN